jgi:ABC-type bacteriocin/lantibiotic exporter with double-glycine peptidase domain
MVYTDRRADIAQASAAANRILSFRGKPENDGEEVPLAIWNSQGGVEVKFEDIWFQYPTRDVPVLSGLNLTVSLRYDKHCAHQN